MSICHQSHDGFPLGFERSSHLEEYTRSRPASAGSRPRSLLNKVSTAAAAVQLDDEAEPADAEPWVLEGWGDGPSVSEVAQQAALRMGPYVKNVPTTLVGLGAGGGRRVLSAGHQGRPPLKLSEARRKPGPVPPYSQGDRRASGPAALTVGGQAATASLRRTAMQRTLEVGDESDVEPTMSTGGCGATPSHPVPQALPAHPQAPQAHSRITPAQRAGAGLRQQNVQQIAQSALNGSTRLGRRETAAGMSSSVAAAAAPSQASPSAAAGSAAADPSNGGSPRYRSVSAETYSPVSHGGAPASSVTARVPNVSVRGVPSGSGSPLHPIAPAAHGHPPLPPPHPPTHLEQLAAPGGRCTGGRPSPGPSDPNLTLSDRPASGPHADSQPTRSISFSSSAVSQPTNLHDHHDSILSPATGHAFSGAAAAASPLSSPGLTLGPGGQAGAPLLPGLLAAGRRGNSFRADASGWSGWDPEGPAVPSQPPPGAAPQASSNVSLWIGTTAASVGGSGPQALVAGTAATPAAAASSSGRGSALPASQPPPRRDGSSRMQRGAGATSTGLLDLSLGPDRSSERAVQAASLSFTRAGRPQAGGTSHGAGSSRSVSPDAAGRGCPPGFSAPRQDALTEFCASRAELGSAGAAGSGPGSVSGAASADGRGPGGNSAGVAAGMPASVPLRVPSLTRLWAVSAEPT